MNQPSEESSGAAKGLVPPEVPDFELLRPIGEGGFGRVWMARNRSTGRLRAIKLIPKTRVGTSDPAGRELASITRLEANLQQHHPNLLTIHHVGQTDEYLFYVMDLADDLKGAKKIEPADYEPATLRRRLDDGPLAADECLARVKELLRGLASLHESGMVHRDVKPTNCLMVDGQLRLADFGLLTRTGLQVSRIGTEKYMPPDGRMDTRADIYAAGLVIYEILTGRSADRFPQLGDCTDAILADATLSALMSLALDACSRDPESRFTDAPQMLAALERRIQPSHRPATMSKRLRTIGLIVVTTAALLALGTQVWLYNYVQNVPRVQVNFITYPFDATIVLDGEPLLDDKGNPLKTPFTVDHLPAQSHHVVFQLDGKPDLDAGRVDFMKTRQVVKRWKND